MTSNIGTRQLKEFGSGVGFNTRSIDKEYTHSILQKALNKAFAPEFLNRIDDIVMFDTLDKDAIFKIIDIELVSFLNRINALGYNLEITNNAKDFIAEKGYDVQYGARPLKRAIQKYLEDELSEILLQLNTSGEKYETIDVSYNEGDEKLTIHLSKEYISQE